MTNQYFISCVLAIVLLVNVHGIAQSEVNLETLVLVQTIFRHGDRNPEYAYPKDKYQNESLWPGGWGQLTQRGRLQAFNLGRFFRRRYDGFLNKSYETNDVHALSSDKTRAIVSLLLVLAGLYPAVSGNNWSEQINWQPVALRTIPKPQDNMLWMSKPCPMYWKKFNDFMYNSDVMKKINSRNQDLYLFLTEKTGVNISHINHFYKFYSTLKIEKFHNFTLPDWAPQIIYSDHFNHLYNLSMQSLTYTKEFKRLRSGPLLKYLVENIKKKVGVGSYDGTGAKEKLFLLSAHDITLSHLLDTLGVFDMHIPDFASAIIIECHRKLFSPNAYYINLLYRNDTRKEPYKLTLPNCNYDCPLDTFISLTNSFIPSDWENECSSPSAKKYYFSGEMLAAALGGLVMLFLLIIGVVVIVNKRRRSPENAFTCGRFFL